MVNAADIDRAAARIEPHTLRTPLLACARLSDDLGADVRLKAENLQHTGSFKVRGAFNALLGRRERGEAMAGVATFSAGNHAAATAFAGRGFGLPVVVCMPSQAVSSKVEAVRRYGGEILFTDDLLGNCHQVAAERGYAVLHPFDDPDVIAGQGTVGLELVDFAPDLVLVPVGGGGLISGVSTAIKLASPATRVIGVEPSISNAMSHALRVGRPEPLPPRARTMADGLSAPFAGEHTLAHVREHVDAVLEVDEDAIAAAWWELLDQSKLLVEPAAAVTLAAVRAGLVPIAPDERVVFVISGGNTSPTALAALGSG